MTQPPPQRPDKPAYELDYARPEPIRPAGDMSYGGQIAQGFAAVMLAAMAGGVLWIAIDTAIPGAKLILWLGPLVALVGLGYLTHIAERRWHWKGFVVGVLGALGLVFLLVGLCAITTFR